MLCTDLEALVLENLLYGDVGGGGIIEELCLKDDTEGAVSNDFAVCVS